MSIVFIINFCGLKLFKLDVETSKKYPSSSRIDKLQNRRITQNAGNFGSYLQKKVVQNISDNYYLGKCTKNFHSDHKSICSKNVYSKYSKKLFTSKAKNRDRLFKESDRAFNNERFIQKIEIPWIYECTLKFSDENEAEINQVLYYK